MFCMLFAAPRTLLHNAFFDAVTTLLHLLALFFSPSGAAVCAQHMESAAPRCGAQACQTKKLKLYTLL